MRGPYSCKKGHSVVRLCGYSLCFREVLPNRNSCDHEHDVLAARESAGKVLHPEITTTSGEWLFRERIRLGLTRMQVCEPLTNRWGYGLHPTSLLFIEVDDLPVPPDWLEPLFSMRFRPPLFYELDRQNDSNGLDDHLDERGGINLGALRLEEQRRKCAEDELAMAQRLVAAAMADEAIREINDSSVKEVRLQLEQQRIVLVCGCGARTSIQIANDGHAWSKE